MLYIRKCLPKTLCLPISDQDRTRTDTELPPRDFLNTMTFVTSICCLCSGLYLDHIFSDLGPLRQVSTPSLFLRLGSVLAVKPSPTLKRSTLTVSYQALKLYLSPQCLPIPPQGHRYRLN